MALAKSSPFVKQVNRVTGTALVNHTSIASIFKDIKKKFDSMYQTKAYLATFASELGDTTEFDSSKLLFISSFSLLFIISIIFLIRFNIVCDIHNLK